MKVIVPSKSTFSRIKGKVRDGMEMRCGGGGKCSCSACGSCRCTPCKRARDTIIMVR